MTENRVHRAGGQDVRPMDLWRERARRLERLALLGIAGAAFFAVALVALHFLEPETNDTDAISEYALGRYGLLMNAAFLVLGAGYLALAAGLRGATRATRASRIGCALLGLAGVGLLFLGAGNIDATGAPSTVHGLVHGVGFLVYFPCAFAATLTLTRAFKQDHRWRALRPWSLALGLGAVVAFALSFADVSSPIFFRVCVGALVLWLFLTATRLRSIARGGREG